MLAHSTGQVNTWTVERRHQDGIEVAPPARNVEPYELLPYFRGIVGRAMAGKHVTIFGKGASHHGWFGWFGWLLFVFLGVGGGVFLLKVFNFSGFQNFTNCQKEESLLRSQDFYEKT